MSDVYVMAGVVATAACFGTVLGHGLLGLVGWAVLKVQADWERQGR